jgi:hypothetical protein
MTNIELARWLHDNYEAVAKEQNWNTQQSCKVEFDTLPDANKRTMIEIADRLLNFNLLRLHFVMVELACPRCGSTNTAPSDKDNDAGCYACGFVWQDN